MIRLEFRVSNEGARAARSELRAFLSYAAERAASVRADRPNPSPIRAHVVITEIIESLDRELARIG